MSAKSIFKQMQKFHAHYGFHEAVRNLDDEMLRRLLDFRMGMMQEEIFELEEAIENEDPEEVVDAIIDLIVFAAGTLDMFDVNGDKAWDEIYRANMNKQVGIKEGRENPYGLPDLVKPEGWIKPSHYDNVGKLGRIFSNE